MLSAYCPCQGSVKEGNKEGRYQIDGTNLEFKVKYKIKDMDEESPLPSSIFLSESYQQLLEDCPSEDTQSIYIPVYEGGALIGIVQAQSTLVKGSKSLNLDQNATGIWGQFRKFVAKNYNRYWFVVGNLLLTGNFGMQFKGKSSRESFVILDMVTQHALPVIEKHKNIRFKYLFYKDFSEEEAAQSEILSQRNFNCFKSEPSMVMELQPDWKEFSDYLGAMSSKYRVRAKRAAKKGKDLKRVDMTYEQLLENKERIHELYEKISLSVDFNLVHLNKDYFPELKNKLGDKFKLVAYYLEDVMIGYFTTIKDHHETHAHFLGLDPSYNQKYQLYLNILYDITKVGIENQSKMIDFARTAPEIKSSVGAVPKETYLFLRHRNGLKNKLVSPIIKSLQPQKEIVYRSPFKASDTAKNDGKKGPKAVSDTHQPGTL